MSPLAIQLSRQLPALVAADGRATTCIRRSSALIALAPDKQRLCGDQVRREWSNIQLSSPVRILASDSPETRPRGRRAREATPEAANERASSSNRRRRGERNLLYAGSSCALRAPAAARVQMHRPEALRVIWAADKPGETCGSRRVERDERAEAGKTTKVMSFVG